MNQLTLREDGFPNFEVPWIERWREADFSWSGLLNRPSWLSGQPGTLQDFFRRIYRNSSESDLLNAGILMNCGDEGPYHVLFIPEEWAISKKVEISSDGLLSLKRQQWEKLFSEGGVRETANLVISGTDLPTDVEQRLVSGFRASFEWIRFRFPLRNIPRRGDRSFTQCAFQEEVIFYGRTNSEGGQSTVHFTWCEFNKRILVEQVSDLELLDINGSALGGKLDIIDSDLKKLRVDDCEASTFSMTDTTLHGLLTIGMSSLEWIEWINCTFDAHVLLVDAAIRKSLAWLACDFRSRVTLASMTWPTLPYACASASGSKFDGIVEIAGGEPPPVQLFQEAEFRSKVSLSGFSDKLKRESFKAELAAIGSQAVADFNKQEHAQTVESGCRTLRKVAEAAGDVNSEHLWHRSELIARKARGDSAASEKGFSNLYGLLADYGLSIARPFGVLAFSIIVFGLLYGWLGGACWFGRLDLHSIEEGFGYSLNRTIPIGVFGDESNPWRHHLLGSGGQLLHIAIRAVATAQSLFSAVLIYLGVMAIRRKFRIS
jgi:hypothetical protein